MPRDDHDDLKGGITMTRPRGRVASETAGEEHAAMTDLHARAWAFTKAGERDPARALELAAVDLLLDRRRAPDADKPQSCGFGGLVHAKPGTDDVVIEIREEEEGFVMVTIMDTPDGVFGAEDTELRGAIVSRSDLLARLGSTSDEMRSRSSARADALKAIADHGYMSPTTSTASGLAHVMDWMVDTARAAIDGVPAPELTEGPDGRPTPADCARADWGDALGLDPNGAPYTTDALEDETRRLIGKVVQPAEEPDTPSTFYEIEADERDATPGILDVEISDSLCALVDVKDGAANIREWLSAGSTGPARHGMTDPRARVNFGSASEDLPNGRYAMTWIADESNARVVVAKAHLPLLTATERERIQSRVEDLTRVVKAEVQILTGLRDGMTGEATGVRREPLARATAMLGTIIDRLAAATEDP